MTVDGVRVSVQVAGASVVPPPVGHVIVVADYLARVRIDGVIRSDQWIRVRRT